MKSTLRIVSLAMISLTAIYADIITDPGTNEPTTPEVEEPGPDPGLILNGPFDEVHPVESGPPPIYYQSPEPVLIGTPEPGALALFGAGLAVLYFRWRYRSGCTRIASPSTHK